ncbi:MAG TPA: hypothetical protein DEG06_07945 [Lachnospiraceae bacterium]|nr:hypothetical protein [Lachnospiraceae bacterium]HBY72159.1 hypothetical protein [Lachnospiraceae bacterium]HCM12793.1 hypothetical protein [Lachnospiraceae bacterium]HCR40343.1 hypothetical protein [Lachnospiraceae bacterium]
MTSELSIQEGLYLPLHICTGMENGRTICFLSFPSFEQCIIGRSQTLVFYRIGKGILYDKKFGAVLLAGWSNLWQTRYKING